MVAPIDREAGYDIIEVSNNKLVKSNQWFIINAAF